MPSVIQEGLSSLAPADGCQVQHPPGPPVLVALGNMVLSKEQIRCLLTWLIWPAHKPGDLRSVWVFYSHRHHGHLPARQRFSLAVQSAVVHQGELTGSAFRTGPSLLLAPSLLRAFFVQCSDGISIKSAAGVCKEQIIPGHSSDYAAHRQGSCCL